MADHRWISREEVVRLTGRNGDSLNRWIAYGKIRSMRRLRPPFRRVYDCRDAGTSRPSRPIEKVSDA